MTFGLLHISIVKIIFISVLLFLPNNRYWTTEAWHYSLRDILSIIYHETGETNTVVKDNNLLELHIFFLIVHTFYRHPVYFLFDGSVTFFLYNFYNIDTQKLVTVLLKLYLLTFLAKQRNLNKLQTQHLILYYLIKL